MHEMSIAESLLEMISEESRSHELEKVKVVRIQVGVLAAVVPEALEFCFKIASQDTVASEAILEIETVPAVARCPQCRIFFEVEDQIFLCPECRELTMELVSGRELTLLSIEGEVEDKDVAS